MNVAELVEWLGAELDRDREHHSDVLTGHGWAWFEGSESASERALVEVAANRRIVRTHEGRHDCRATWPPDASRGEIEWTRGEREYEADEPCPTLRLLALPYADRPGYRPEWAPAPTNDE
jgi:hypothetical protein